MDYIGVKLHKDRSGMLAFCRRHDRLYLYGNGWVGFFSIWKRKG